MLKGVETQMEPAELKPLKTCFVIAHHHSAPIIKLPKNGLVNYIRTLRLDPNQSGLPLHRELGFLEVSPPDNLPFSSLAFSDSLLFFNAASIVNGYDYIGFFQYRRILGVRNKSDHPAVHRFRIQSRTLLKGLERIATSHRGDKIFVANPLRVISLEDQYSQSHPETLHIMKRLRSVFHKNLSQSGMDTSQINPEIFFWSSLYLGPSRYLLEFQALLLRTFETLDASTVPNGLSPYQSRWVGFIVERLFSDYVQCLGHSHPGRLLTSPVIMLNELPGISRLKKIFGFI
jgi:hypothetical protein